MRFLICLLLASSNLIAMQKPVISVRDYLHKNPAIIAERSFSYKIPKSLMTKYDNSEEGKTLNLERLQLNSLDGLSDVPDIEQITTIFLGDNQIEDLPLGIFKNYKSVTHLYIGENSITQLAPEALKDLPQLRLLDISRIKLHEDNIKQLMSTLPKVAFIIKSY